MPRRSIPRRVLDDAAFPIRAKLRVPELGFGNRLLEMLRWLQEELGDGNSARHEAEVLEGEALAIHFRRIEDALDFMSAFPNLELADGTASRAYTPPPLGRMAG